MPIDKKVGLIVDSETIPWFAADFISSCEFELIICNLSIRNSGLSEVGPKDRSIINRIGSSNIFNLLIEFKWMTALSILLLRLVKFYEVKWVRAYLEPLYREHLDIKSTGFFCVELKGWKSEKNVFYLEDGILIPECDLYINFSGYILSEKLLNVFPDQAPVLSLHHGDNSIYRGAPAGFWETYNSEKLTGLVVQKLTKELDGGIVVAEAFVNTRPLWHQTNFYITGLSSQILLKTISEFFENGSFLQERLSFFYANRLFAVPSFFQLVKYIIKCYPRHFIELMRRHGYLRADWHLRICKRKSGFSQRLLEYDMELRARDGFIADPCLYNVSDSETVIFAEKFSHSVNKGHIVKFEISNTEIREEQLIIEEDFHLSFPYVFRSLDKTFMTVESVKTRSIRLYIADDEKLDNWSFCKTLIENIDLVDPIIIPITEKKWLLLASGGVGASDDHSSLLWAIEGSYVEGFDWDCRYLVRTSADGARNGGLFAEKNTFYRVGQCHEPLKYGRSIKIFEVMSLSPYWEVEISEVKFKEFRCHGLSVVDNYICYDVLKI